MKLKVNLREFIEDNAHNGNLHVSACIDLEDLFEGNAIPEEQEIDVDLHDLLAENRQIAHVWSIHDVRQQRPDLDDEQAWAVLQAVAEGLDSNRGITWDLIDTIADELYPERPERRWQGRIDVSVENYSRDEAMEHFTELAKHLEKDAVNHTTRAQFEAGSLRPAEPSETISE